jgi:hypothetical protein
MKGVCRGKCFSFTTQLTLLNRKLPGAFDDRCSLDSITSGFCLRKRHFRLNMDVVRTIFLALLVAYL